MKRDIKVEIETGRNIDKKECVRKEDKRINEDIQR